MGDLSQMKPHYPGETINYVINKCYFKFEWFRSDSTLQ